MIDVNSDILKKIVIGDISESGRIEMEVLANAVLDLRKRFVELEIDNKKLKTALQHKTLGDVMACCED